MPLTDDAKKELAEAIAIVREDRIDKMLRTRLAGPKTEPPKTDPNDPTPPPPKDDPTEPPEPPKGRGYWGELLSD